MGLDLAVRNVSWGIGLFVAANAVLTTLALVCPVIYYLLEAKRTDAGNGRSL
jgi:hypothetical protein